MGLGGADLNGGGNTFCCAWSRVFVRGEWFTTVGLIIFIPLAFPFGWCNRPLLLWSMLEGAGGLRILSDERIRSVWIVAVNE